MNLGMSHLHGRKRASRSARGPRGLEPYPSPRFFRRMYDYFMYSVGVVQPAALLPQVFAIYILNQKEGVSIVTWGLLTVFNILWAIYGWLHREWPIFIANILLMVLDLLIVFGVLFY